MLTPRTLLVALLALLALTPLSQAALEDDEVTLEILLDSTGSARLRDTAVNDETLRSVLQWAFRSGKGPALWIRAHSDCSLARVLDVLALAREAGFETVRIGTEDKVFVAPEVRRSERVAEPERDRSVALAVERGLRWLRTHQDARGCWDANGFHVQCEADPLHGGYCTGSGDSLHDVGVTALSLLAFLGSGTTTTRGTDQDAVRRAVDFLVGVQDSELGLIGTASSRHFMYSHALATLALVESYRLCADQGLREPAQAAVHFLHRARNPYKAWRYSYPPDGDNDTSVTGIALWALLAARDAGLSVDEQALDDGFAYLDEMTDPRTGRTGYHERGSSPARSVRAMGRWPAESSESLTALAILLRRLAGRNVADVAETPGVELLTAKLPGHADPGAVDFYYWHHGTYALRQVGGEAWTRWRKAVRAALPDLQDANGSWNPALDPWGEEGGRVSSTALNLLTLEAELRSDRLARPTAQQDR